MDSSNQGLMQARQSGSLPSVGGVVRFPPQARPKNSHPQAPGPQAPGPNWRRRPRTELAISQSTLDPTLSVNPEIAPPPPTRRDDGPMGTGEQATDIFITNPRYQLRSRS